MSSKRSQRLAFAVFVAVALCIIGRNLYKRYMNAQLFRAIASHDVDEARSLLNRGADVNATQDTTPALLEAMSQLTPPSMILTLSIPGQVLTPPSQDIPADAEAVACLLIERHADLRMPRISVAVGEQPKVSGYDDAGYVEEACRHGSIPVLRCLLNRGVALTPRCLDAALQYVSLASSGSTTFSGSGTAQVESAAAKAEKAKQALRLAQQKEVIRQMAQLLREHGLRPTLAQCVELNDVTALKAALDAGISPEPQSSNTEPTLITAVRKGNLEMVTLLLAHGADANSHTGYGDSALNVAVAQGNLEVVKLLLAHGADVKGGKTSTALEHAMWGKHLAIARLLLAKGADPNFTFGSAAYSALPEAILSLPEIVPELLQHGVNLNAGNGAVLRAALRTRRIALVQELLRRGVNVNPLPPPATPTTAAGGSLAAPSATTPAQGITDAPDPTHPGQRIPQPFSPLLNATFYAPEAELLLLKAGANIGTDKTTVLAALAKCGRADLFARTLELGADVNGVDGDGETALTRAVKLAPEGVSVLLAHGANPNFVTRTQRAPLDLAASVGNVDCARLLLAHGANINLCPPHGHTPLYWARKHNADHVVQAVDKNLQSITAVVHGGGNAEMITLLEQAGAKAE